jgi:serine/threonine protein kinase/Flp pilus assembly protein TadD
MIGKTISHYKILEKLGEGGMGVVYKAQDTRLDRLVAIKFLPQHLISDSVEKERFIHEAKAASALSHANITTIYEIDEFEGQMFIVMEYCEGKTLKKTIDKETLSIKKVLDIGIQICEGLNAAHKKEIVHRDIKSENIMLTREGQIKIMDFGLAKLKGATKLTKSRSTLGTAAYMSPEQASGEEVDSRSDIFSFGVVLYELLTGQLPFQGDHQAATVYSIVNEEPQPVARFNSKVSQELQRIVSKALEKEKEERYQHADELLADLRRERKSLEYVKTAQIPPEVIPPKPKKKVLPFIIPASIVFALILLFLILKPFKFQIAPEEKAIAEENSLAIMYFENMVDPEDNDRTAQMITALLITDLSESQYMRVVSRQRLYDILKLLGKEDLKKIDRSVASEVAKKAGVKWILTGSILQTEPSIVLTSDISEAETGGILATQRITGEKGEDLFTVVDKLSAEIKNDLSLPEAAKREVDRPVADVTTHSPEAYRYYLEGVDYGWKFYFTDAEKSFEKALELDSTLVMAYYYLGGLKPTEEAKRLLTRAMKFLDKASEKEKHYIKGIYAYRSGDNLQAIEELQKIVERYPDEKEAFWTLGHICYYRLQQFEQAIYYFNKSIVIDPLYKIAYNSLAYAYDDMGDFEKSIWAINQYINIAPDEANPYDSRADLYAYNGKINQAIESYKKALEIKPDFYRSIEKLGHMHLFKRQYAIAESCYKELASSNDKDIRSRGRSHLAKIPLFQGKFQEALEVLEHGIVADKMEKVQGTWLADKHYLKANIYLDKKDKSKAVSEAKAFRQIIEKAQPQDVVGWRHYQIDILARSGELSEAEKEAKELKKDMEQKDTSKMLKYWQALGSIELAKGNGEAAISYFEKDTLGLKSVEFNWKIMLAKAYLETDKLGKPVALLEKAVSSYDEDRTYFPIMSVKAHYLLGLAYEKSGWNDKAIEQYEEFLDIWKDADPGIHEVENAKERVKKLRVESKE